jgi:parallel beta-helix repeat protein
MNKLFIVFSLFIVLAVFTGCKYDYDEPETVTYIDKNTTWKDKVGGEGIDYRFDKPIRIAKEITLTIEPGVRIEFENETCEMSVLGTLKMIGTPEKPIILESKSKVPGSWVGIFSNQLESASIIMENVIVNYAGKAVDSNSSSYAVSLKTKRFCSIKNCTISGSANNGIYLFSDSIEFAKNTIVNCYKAPVVCRINHLNILDTLSNYKDGNGEAFIKIDKGGTEIKGKIEAFPLNVPYRITSNMEIFFPFYIKPGCVFEMAPNTGLYTDASSETASIISKGFINAEGESGKRIVFKGSTEGKGTWYGIFFYNKSNENRLVWCNITGAGAMGETAGEGYSWWFPADSAIIGIGRWIYPARVVVNYCSLSESAGWGIKVKKESEAYIENNKFSNNKLGDVFYEK